MIEAAMIWNEPNNKSHWDPEIDPDWSCFARMAILAAQAIRAERSQLPRVLGGISPIDPAFLENLAGKGGEQRGLRGLHLSRAPSRRGWDTRRADHPGRAARPPACTGRPPLPGAR